MRASRVRKPARLSGKRSSGSASTSARAMPWRTAPAWPLGPPPCTRTRTSYVPSTPEIRSGAITIERWSARGKCSSSGRPLNHVAPSPGRRITRATDVLRFPVPWYCAIGVGGNSVLQRQRLGRLRLVGMIGTGVDLELRDLRAREAVAGQHPLHGLAQHLGRAALELLAERPRAEPAGIAGMAVIELLVELVPRDVDLLRVDHDDEVTGVDVRRVLRLVLAAQRVGDRRRKPPERLAVGVDDVPLASDLSGLGV